MPDPTFDFQTEWTSGGVRQFYGVECNCGPVNRPACLSACEADFNESVAILKVLHPED